MSTRHADDETLKYIAELEAEKKIRLTQLSDVTLRMRELEAEQEKLLAIAEAAEVSCKVNFSGGFVGIRDALKEWRK